MSSRVLWRPARSALSQGPRAEDPCRARAGRVPLALPLALVAGVTLWIVDGLSSDVLAAGFARIDPRSSKLDVRGGFVDPRWNEALATELARHPPVSPHDRSGVRDLARAVAALPFVKEVGEPLVLWPNGVDVPVRLRVPVACVSQGGQFVVVADDGTLLPGRWPTPPWADSGDGHIGFLPLIGPNDGSFDRMRPGDRLAQATDQDALQVAIAMRAALTQADFDVLGPPLIDARHARAASVEDPGVVFYLEERRVVWFGRPPNARAPGERPDANKWDDVQRAAASLRGLGQHPPPPGARDWSFLDVRWDTPDITWRDTTMDEPVAAGSTSTKPN